MPATTAIIETTRTIEAAMNAAARAAGPTGSDPAADDIPTTLAEEIIVLITAEETTGKPNTTAADRAA